MVAVQSKLYDVLGGDTYTESCILATLWKGRGVVERVLITNPFINLLTMQVCAVKDATDEEILQVCNSMSPAGTSGGWATVIRTMEDTEYPEALPVKCSDYIDRMHYLVVC